MFKFGQAIVSFFQRGLKSVPHFTPQKPQKGLAGISYRKSTNSPKTDLATGFNFSKVKFPKPNFAQHVNGRFSKKLSRSFVLILVTFLAISSVSASTLSIVSPSFARQGLMSGLLKKLGLGNLKDQNKKDQNESSENKGITAQAAPASAISSSSRSSSSVSQSSSSVSSSSSSVRSSSSSVATSISSSSRTSSSRTSSSVRSSSSSSSSNNATLIALQTDSKFKLGLDTSFNLRLYDSTTNSSSSFSALSSTGNVNSKPGIQKLFYNTATNQIQLDNNKIGTVDSCLTVQGFVQNVIAKACSLTDDNQKFFLENFQADPNKPSIKTKNTFYNNWSGTNVQNCLDVDWMPDNSTFKNGQRVLIYDCAGSINQLMKFEPLPTSSSSSSRSSSSRISSSSRSSSNSSSSISNSSNSNSNSSSSRSTSSSSNSSSRSSSLVSSSSSSQGQLYFTISPTDAGGNGYKLSTADSTGTENSGIKFTNSTTINDQQRWFFEGSSKLIKSAILNRCLATAANQPHTNLVLKTCNSTDNTQIWDNSSDLIKNVFTGKCMVGAWTQNLTTQVWEDKWFDGRNANLDDGCNWGFKLLVIPTGQSSSSSSKSSNSSSSTSSSTSSTSNSSSSSSNSSSSALSCNNSSISSQGVSSSSSSRSSSSATLSLSSRSSRSTNNSSSTSSLTSSSCSFAPFISTPTEQIVKDTTNALEGLDFRVFVECVDDGPNGTFSAVFGYTNNKTNRVDFATIGSTAADIASTSRLVPDRPVIHTHFDIKKIKDLVAGSTDETPIKNTAITYLQGVSTNTLSSLSSALSSNNSTTNSSSSVNPNSSANSSSSSRSSSSNSNSNSSSSRSSSSVSNSTNPQSSSASANSTSSQANPNSRTESRAMIAEGQGTETLKWSFSVKNAAGITKEYTIGADKTFAKKCPKPEVKTIAPSTLSSTVADQITPKAQLVQDTVPADPNNPVNLALASNHYGYIGLKDNWNSSNPSNSLVIQAPTNFSLPSAANPSLTPNNLVELINYTGENSQRWQYNPSTLELSLSVLMLSNNNYVPTKVCLQATSQNNASQVSLNTCDNSTNQKWSFLENGQIVLKPTLSSNQIGSSTATLSGMCLDAIKDNAGNFLNWGNRLQLWTCSNTSTATSNQKFVFHKLETKDAGISTNTLSSINSALSSNSSTTNSSSSANTNSSVTLSSSSRSSSSNSSSSSRLSSSSNSTSAISSSALSSSSSSSSPANVILPDPTTRGYLIFKDALTNPKTSNIYLQTPENASDTNNNPRANRIQTSAALGNGNQVWQYDPVSLELRQHYNSNGKILVLCLDATTSQKGSWINTAPCTGGDNQKWRFETNGNLSVKSSAGNVNSESRSTYGLCMSPEYQTRTVLAKPATSTSAAVPASSETVYAALGINFSLNDCKGTADQTFAFRTNSNLSANNNFVAVASYIASNVMTNWRLQAPISTEAVVNAELYGRTGQHNQKWYYDPSTWELQTITNGKNMCLDGQDSKLQAQVKVAECSGQDNQKWKLETTGEITLKSSVTNATSGGIAAGQLDPTNADFKKARWCLELFESKLFTHNKFVLGKCTGTANTQFTLQKITQDGTVNSEDKDIVDMTIDDWSGKGFKFEVKEGLDYEDNVVWMGLTSNNVNQRWRYNFDSKEVLYGTRCLDFSSNKLNNVAANPTTNIGSVLVIKKCDGSLRQKWKFEFHNGLPRIMNIGTPYKSLELNTALDAWRPNLCVDAQWHYNAYTATPFWDGQKLSLQPCTQHTLQRFGASHLDWSKQARSQDEVSKLAGGNAEDANAKVKGKPIQKGGLETYDNHRNALNYLGYFSRRSINGSQLQLSDKTRSVGDFQGRLNKVPAPTTGVSDDSTLAFIPRRTMAIDTEYNPNTKQIKFFSPDRSNYATDSITNSKIGLLDQLTNDPEQNPSPPGNGACLTGLFNADGITVNPNDNENYGLSLEPCNNTFNQMWIVNSVVNRIQLAGTDLCLRVLNQNQWDKPDTVLASAVGQSATGMSVNMGPCEFSQADEYKQATYENYGDSHQDFKIKNLGTGRQVNDIMVIGHPYIAVRPSINKEIRRCKDFGYTNRDTGRSTIGCIFDIVSLQDFVTKSLRAADLSKEDFEKYGKDMMLREAEQAAVSASSACGSTPMFPISSGGYSSAASFCSASKQIATNAAYTYNKTFGEPIPSQNITPTNCSSGGGNTIVAGIVTSAVQCKELSESNGGENFAYTTTSGDFAKSSTQTAYEITYLFDQNYVMDLQGSNTSDGTPVWLYSRNGTDAQRWWYFPLTGEIKTSVTDVDKNQVGWWSSLRCVDSGDYYNPSNRHLRINTCNGSSSQSWIISGDYSIRVRDDTNLCVNVLGGISSGSKMGIGNCSKTNCYSYWEFMDGKGEYDSASIPKGCQESKRPLGNINQIIDEQNSEDGGNLGGSTNIQPKIPNTNADPDDEDEGIDVNNIETELNIGWDVVIGKADYSSQYYVKKFNDSLLNNECYNILGCVGVYLSTTGNWIKYLARVAWGAIKGLIRLGIDIGELALLSFQSFIDIFSNPAKVEENKRLIREIRASINFDSVFNSFVKSAENTEESLFDLLDRFDYMDFFEASEHLTYHMMIGWGYYRALAQSIKSIGQIGSGVIAASKSVGVKLGSAYNFARALITNGRIQLYNFTISGVSTINGVVRVRVSQVIELIRTGKWSSVEKILEENSIKLALRVWQFQKNNWLPNFSKSLNSAKQNRHIVGTQNYTPGKSILTENPQNLLNDFAGKGNPRFTADKNLVLHREYVNFGKNIGVYKSQNGQIIQNTTKGIIHHGQNGAHIVPSRP
jgi:hypothetical protein